MAKKRRFVNATMAVVAFCAILAVPVSALDPQKSLTQFIHRTWLVDQGIGDVYSIAQTTDGYLWLATSNGTFRFDGVRFSRLDTDPAEPRRVGSAPYQVLGGRDGSLWIGRGEKIVRILAGKQTVYAEEDGLPGGLVDSLREANDGTVYVSAMSGISRFSSERWQKLEREDGGALYNPLGTVLDQKQNLWTTIFDRSTSRPIFALLRVGEEKFQVVGRTISPAHSLAAAPDGKIWATTAGAKDAVRVYVSNQSGIHVEGSFDVNSGNMLFDRDGGLWITTLNDGLRRVGNTHSIEHIDTERFVPARDTFTQKDGLSSNRALCAFEDRDGGIWIGTSVGLDYFRESKITSISAREGLPFDQNLVLQPADNGGIWAASSSRGFEKIELPGQQYTDLRWLNLANNAHHFLLRCVYADPQGGLLVGTGGGVLRIPTDVTAAGLLDGMPAVNLNWNLRQVQAMSRGNDGTLWLCDEFDGVFRLQGKQLERVLLPARDFALGPAARTCYADPTGRLWMGAGAYAWSAEEERLGCYEEGKLRWYSRNEGLLLDRIQSIFSDAKGQVWVAGRGGISRFENGRFQTLTRENGLPDDNLVSALQDDEGFFWLAGRSSLFRVSSSELENALATKTGVVRGEFFDKDDGLRGFVDGPAEAGAGVVAAKSADGRLWFPTSTGVASVFPRQIYRNTAPPPVHVRRIVAEGKSYRAGEALAFPIGTRNCEFDYVGICFTNPEKVRYRYKLEGYDGKWVDAGSRAQAFYSNLRPGSYRFQVLACNDEGVWNETGDTVAFSIAPAFYQRTWFPLVWLLPAAVALWGVHRLRLSRLAARMNLRLESQTAERKRIARELHDTLLQGFIGVGLKLDAIATNLPEPLAPVRDQLRKILDQSDRYLAEARRSVMELRSTTPEKGGDFFQALSAAAERLAEGTGIQLSYSVDGERRSLAPLIESNLLRIGEEAVSNAVRHAQATKVELNLTFERKEVSLRIQDNGRGFEPQGPEAVKAGHFGLVGIRERVNAMDGRLSLTSQPGKGTEIIVTIPTG